MGVQKPYVDKEPTLCHALETSPEILRAWADKLEKKGEFATPGQVIRLQVSNELELFYDPRVPTTKYLRDTLTRPFVACPPLKEIKEGTP